ncbi:hypothetical protein BJ085DRAFT_35330, partial [Dimargaris cristalligena]
PNPYESTTTTTNDIATDSTVNPNPYESSSAATDDVVTTTNLAPETSTSAEEPLVTTTSVAPAATATPTVCDPSAPDSKLIKIHVTGTNEEEKADGRDHIIDGLNGSDICFDLTNYDSWNNLIEIRSFINYIDAIWAIGYVQNIEVL